MAPTLTLPPEGERWVGGKMIYLHELIDGSGSNFGKKSKTFPLFSSSGFHK
jgi:hypothetical protein